MKIAVVAVAAALTGCAEPYWQKTHDAIPVRAVVERHNPGNVPGGQLLGYANRAAGIIEIRRGLSPRLRKCIESHERRHFEGYTHGIGQHFAIDCGDGTMIRRGGD